MNNENWVKFMTDKGTETITDIDGLKLLEAREEEVTTVFNSRPIKGADGVIPGSINFEPFNLTLRFSYRATDLNDYNLFKTKMRGVLFKRTPFYISFSDLPGKRYAVICESNSINDLVAGKLGEFEVSYLVYKGYSESAYKTNEYGTTSEKWQFGNGLIANEDIKYKHSTSSFKIFNGSDDVISPYIPYRHDLTIKIKVNAPNGFKLINKTTGDVFEYKKSITTKKELILNGVYPSIDGKRVGIDTNHEWLTLEQGYNNIEITGEDLTDPNVEFIFPFVYR
ncbi:phage tail domain-containing protein [Mammaliicoccus sciuri]|uniref:phage tail domain-containing protein n=1 Tax=Mammaliicoccus sciuri TaxID=1296 RepID=UPI002DBAFE24|nr:phage tail domain-containing protein [Mammaliicoccus sciuri]MEB6233799.1 phage tail family protein [Mammaliicoccus sciuri]